MYILVPMDSSNLEEASIVKLTDVKFWIQASVVDGKVIDIKYAQSEDGFEELSHIVVNSDNEYVWPFIEKNMLVLVAHFQKSFDDIIEAYLFKELNELAY